MIATILAFALAQEVPSQDEEKFRVPPVDEPALPFSQADASDSRQRGGTGLGLAICRELIERMHGTIGFASEAGQGACFYFELPLAQSGPAAAQPG